MTDLPLREKLEQLRDGCQLAAKRLSALTGNAQLDAERRGERTVYARLASDLCECVAALEAAEQRGAARVEVVRQRITDFSEGYRAGYDAGLNGEASDCEYGVVSVESVKGIRGTGLTPAGRVLDAGGGMSTHQEQAADELLMKLEQLVGVGAFQGALIPMTDLIRAALDAAARTELEQAAEYGATFGTTSMEDSAWDDGYVKGYDAARIALVDMLRARAASLGEQTEDDRLRL